MVFIEARTSYLKKFEEGNDFCFLREFLLEKQVKEITPESSLVHRTLFAIAANDVSQINEVLEDYAAKSPTSESQYIYKDLIVFLFICVTKKFGLDQAWLLKFVQQRKSEEEEKNSITKTFQNLLKDNLESKDNYFEVVIVYKDILGVTEENEEILNAAYENLSRKLFPFYDSDFLNLIAIRAVDLVVLTKGLTTFRPYMNLKEFAGNFERRVQQISRVLIITVFIIIFSVQSYVAYKYFWGEEAQSRIMEKILTVCSYFVIGTIGYSSKRGIEKFFQNQLRKFFGKMSETEDA